MYFAKNSNASYDMKKNVTCKFRLFVHVYTQKKRF